MKLDKKDLKPLHGARKNIKKVRKSLVTSGFFKKSGDIFFGATSQIKKSCLVARLFYFAVRGVCEITEDAGRGDSAESANIAENGS